MTKPPQTTWPGAVADAARVTGGHLRTARLRRNLTQSEVADRLGVHRDTVASLERGNPGAAVGTMLGILWLYGLLPSALRATDPRGDEDGIALEAAEGRERARHGSGGMSNDF